MIFEFHTAAATVNGRIGVYAETVEEAIAKFETVYGPNWTGIEVPVAYFGIGAK